MNFVGHRSNEGNMPRASKGARLAWRDERRKSDGSLRNRGGWFIRDGSSFASTGCKGDRERAEEAPRGSYYQQIQTCPRTRTRPVEPPDCGRRQHLFDRCKNTPTRERLRLAYWRSSSSSATRHMMTSPASCTATMPSPVRLGQLPAASSRLATSILTMSSMAFITRAALAGSGSASNFGRALGMICHDTP